MKQRTTTPDSPSCREQLRRGNVWRRLGMMLALVSTKRLGMMLAVALMTLTATTAQTQGGEAYVRIRSLDQLTDGSKVIIAARYVDEHVTGYYAMKNDTSGKPGGEFFESSGEGYEFLPSIITDSESEYYWTVNVTDGGYTFTNSRDELLGLGNPTDFATNNNTIWTIESETSSGDAMVADYTGFVIKNARIRKRAIAFNDEAFGAYNTSNMNTPDYNFYLDFFVLVSVPASDPVSVSYIDANGDEQTVDATEVTEETATMGASDSETWYFVSGEVENSNRIELLGTVNLILTDYCDFLAYSGLHLASDNTLNIYVQSEGNGYLYAIYDSDGNAAIGGDGGCDDYTMGGSGESSGNVNIYGGVINVDGNLGGGNGGAGFDFYDDPENSDSYEEGTGGNGGDGGTIYIYGGNITVYGVIGGGVKGYGESYDGDDGTATIKLSWTNAGDNVYASQYNGEVELLKAFTDWDGDNYEAGEVDSNDVINEKTLTTPDATSCHPQAEPTCTEVGYVQECWYKYATQKYYTDEACTVEIAESAVVIPALGHMIEHIEAQGATFTTDGNLEYWHCSRCNHYFGDAKGDNDLELDDASSLSYGVEGNATDGYSICMLREATAMLTIDSSVSQFKIYDDGGSTGNYSNYCDGYLVLTAPQGYTIQLTGDLLTETLCDYLTVYAGNTTDGDVLLDEMSSSNEELDPEVFEYIPAHIDQEVSAPSMLLYFHSDYSKTLDGLDLTATLLPVQPVVADLDNNNIDSYVGQLVTIQNMRIFDAGDNMIAFCEEASLTPVGFSNLYDKTLVDLTGIVSLDGQDVVLTATDRSDLDPVVFVIDEDEQYYDLLVCEIENVGVRLKRTLSKDYWNTFCVPFDLSGIDGEIRQFCGVDGSTMIFDRRPAIYTSQPYLVKPYEDIVNPVFRNVTLLNVCPATSGDGDYQFVGTYGSTEMSTQNDNQQVLFLKSNGSLYAPSPGKNTIKGMRAYFRAPKGTEARVSIDGAEQTVIDGVCYQSADDSPCYDLQGRRVNVPVSVPVKKGLYIQGGKKLLVR